MKKQALQKQKMLAHRSAGAVIFRSAKNGILTLLLHYRAGHWDFPKGHIESGETSEETARREIAEETGIKDLVIAPNFKTEIKYWLYDRKIKKRVPKFVVFYVAKTRSKKIRLSSEHVGYIWLTCDEARERLTYKNAKSVLQKAWAHIIHNEGSRMESRPEGGK